MIDRLNKLVVNVLTRNLAREEGQALAEYALILSLVAVAVVVVVAALGTKIGAEITSITNSL